MSRDIDGRLQAIAQAIGDDRPDIVIVNVMELVSYALTDLSRIADSLERLAELDAGP